MHTPRSLPHLILLLLSLALRSGAARAQTAFDGGAPSVSYTVTPRLDSESFDVQATFLNVPADSITFSFPIWAPGAYDVVNFGAYVTDLTASDMAQRKLAIERLDSGRYRLRGTGGGLFTVLYRIHDVEAPPSSVWFCTSDIESTFVFANGAAVFGYAEGYKDLPCRVGFTVPNGWTLASGLGRPAATAKESGGEIEIFGARDYDELIDMPFEMGRMKGKGKKDKEGVLRTADFTVKGKRHTVTVMEIATPGFEGVAMKELADTTRRVVQIVSDFFGEMPYDYYIFQHFIADGDRDRKFHFAYGALEHRNSSSYLSDIPPIPEAFGAEMSTEIAHEYFHLWSPKRIHVSGLGPFDYQHPPNTASLWFAEGITEYYCRILLLRAGMIDRERFLSEFTNDIRELYGAVPRQSMTELSRHISFTSPEESTPALYGKGPVIGLMLDAAIRTQTGNAKSLDDAMRYFNEEYGKKGKSFGDDEIIPIIERATGAKLSDFYARYIDGREPLPVDEYLAKIGLGYLARQFVAPTIGAVLESDSLGFRIASLTAGGSADSMKLRVGDHITAITFNEVEAPTRGLPTEILTYLAGPGRQGFDSLAIVRDGRSFKVPVVALRGPITQRYLDVVPADPAVAAIRRKMLGF